MLITLEPTVVAVGGVAVRWFGLLCVVGLATGLWLTLREASVVGLPREQVLEASAWAIPAGLVGARLLHVLGAWDFYLTRPGETWQITVGGLSLWGALLGGGLAAARLLRHEPEARLRLADAVVPGLALGIAIGRLGAVLSGDGQGLPSDLPWATQYSSEAAAVPDFGVPRHPAQLYDGLVALALLGVVRLLPRRATPGLRFWVVLALYGAARVGLGVVRLDPPFLFGLQLDQLVAAGAAAFAVLQIGRAWAAARPHGARSAPPALGAQRP